MDSDILLRVSSPRMNAFMIEIGEEVPDKFYLKNNTFIKHFLKAKLHRNLKIPPKLIVFL